MNNLRLLVSVFAISGAVALAGCSDDSEVIIDPGGGGGGDATLSVNNQSDFVITEIRVTDVNSTNWGPNLISGDALFPDESLTLAVDCGFYDALIVDEDGVDCEVHDLDLCLNDADWVIRNNTCPVFGAARAAREAAAAAKADTSAPVSTPSI